MKRALKYSMAAMMTGALLLVAGVSPATAAPTETSAAAIVPMASGASPTGQYEWVCVLTTGNTYSMVNGEKLTNCKGSYLQRYLNGKQLAVYRLAYNGSGTLANTKSEGCLLAAIGGVLTVISPAMTIRYIAAAAVGGAGVYYSCLA